MITFSDFFTIVFASLIDYLGVPVISYMLSFLGLAVLCLGIKNLVDSKYC